ncbi:hypothetical protein ACHQM5_016943 [Ranunculus cassubicifolius]
MLMSGPRILVCLGFFFYINFFFFLPYTPTPQGFSSGPPGILQQSQPRLVVKKISAKPQHEGDRAIVRRSIGSQTLDYFDPFLLLDEATIESPAGFPDHPHRGFETVSYMLKGSMLHEDFEGHRGTIEAGDVQWMTAGRGILHSETPPNTGSHRGIQLWVNLSSKQKMVKPRYQDLQSKNISEGEENGVKVRVIAGESMGIKSPIFTMTPTMYLDFTLQPGSHFQQPIPHTWNTFIYVLDGKGVFGKAKAKPSSSHTLLLLGSGDSVEAWNNFSMPLRFLLIGGEPLNEPVERYGPFVMNTHAEINQAIHDYRNCVNGFEKAKYWKSGRSSRRR